MGANYTRQSTYTEGDIIQASDTNDEFDQLLAAFAASTGHTHDGTTGEGGPISTLAGHGLTFGAGTAGTDITITFDGETNDGVLKWMEDEDYFEFSDDILVASSEKLQFRDTALYINSSTDGQLDIVADTLVQVATAAFTVDASGDITLDAGGADVVLKDDGMQQPATDTNNSNDWSHIFLCCYNPRLGFLFCLQKIRMENTNMLNNKRSPEVSSARQIQKRKRVSSSSSSASASAHPSAS